MKCGPEADPQLVYRLAYNDDVVRQTPMRVNLRWRSDDRAGRARPAAAGPHDHRQPIALFGRMLLPLAMVLGLTGCSYVLGPAVSERHALSRAVARHYQKSCAPSISDATLC